MARLAAVDWYTLSKLHISESLPHPNSRPYRVKTRIVEHSSAKEFLSSCAQWLSLREIEDHGVLSLGDVLTSLHPIYSPPFLFAHALSNDEIVGCCIYAEPDGLVLSTLSHQGTLALFEYLQARIEIPSRIFGPYKPALQMARLFSDIRHRPYRIQSAWRVHSLMHLEVGRPSVKGDIRLANSADKNLVRNWGRQYDDEKPANVSIENFLLKKLVDQQLYLWTDDSPKSLATISGANCSGLRISSVFTPHSYRSMGYATSLVHCLSQKYLDSGSAYITLYTQTGDPVERIYRKLGFLPVTEKVSITFGLK